MRKREIYYIALISINHITIDQLGTKDRAIYMSILISALGSGV